MACPIDNFQLFGLLSVLFRVRMKKTAKLQRPKSLLEMFCDKIQMRFQNDLGPIVQPLLYEEIVLAKMLRN